jgi:hypothetical protein
VHMLDTGLTGGYDRSDRCEMNSLQLPCFQLVCMHSSRGRCIGSGGACMCAGGALFGCSSFVSVVCALCLSLVFVSDVSSHCPCLRGPRLVFFKSSYSLPLFGFRSLVGVSFYSFLFLFFFLVLLHVGVVNALIKGEIEGHVWFEDRWMVASLCDE